MESQETKKIEELIQKKIKLAEDLLSLATEQSQLSYVDNSNQYENLVESREIVIEDLKKTDVLIQREIEAASKTVSKTASKTAGKANTNDLLIQFNEANARVSGLAKQILALDEKSKSLMTGELGKIKTKIQDLQKGKQGLNGYNAGTKLNLGGAFTDSKR